MSDFWSLEPEVAGELGDGSVVDTSVHPPNVSKLEYRFTGWLGDELLETFPCYIVTEPLGAALLSAHLTGFQLDDVHVVVSDEFTAMYPGRRLPNFNWLKVHRHPGYRSPDRMERTLRARLAGARHRGREWRRRLGGVGRC